MADNGLISQQFVIKDCLVTESPTLDAESQQKAKKLTIGQKFTNMLLRSKSPTGQSLPCGKTLKIKGFHYREHIEKVSFKVKHKAHIVDIRDEDFNESQKLLTETFEEYFQLIFQALPVRYTPFTDVLSAAFSTKEDKISEESPSA